ncbi:MAG: SufS family cysteine desulfurase [Thalassotalea sp.]|nr:SufS family cysteine desulfurase [Thalassotalea sp.]
MKIFNPASFAKFFPFYEESASSNRPVYFDNAATTQKHKHVIEVTSNFYQAENANVHRAAHKLSAEATVKFEQARETARKFVNAKSTKEIIWTKGTTEGINLIAQCFAQTTLAKGDEIVLSYAEHHANIVPWQQVTQATGAIIKVLPLDNEGRIDKSAISGVFSENTKLVSLVMISNVVGKLNPIEDIVKAARAVGATVVVDAAQAVAHQSIDVQAIDCDFLVFSAHKMFGPTGIGLVYGKEALLDAMPPYQFGGEMIRKVSFSGTSFGELPFKFEAGTPNIVGVIGFAEAMKFVSSLDLRAVADYEESIISYTHKKLSDIPGLTFLFKGKPDVPLFSFNLTDHAKDVASFLDAHNFAVRAGHHCAMPLFEYLEQGGCVRASLAPYNTQTEVDSFIALLHQFVKSGIEAEGEVEASDVSVTTAPSLTPDEASIDDTTVDDATIEVIERFDKAKGWDGKHREIMLLSKLLERMSKTERNESSLVKGCESDVWLKAHLDDDKHWHFSADSDAKVIRGLLVIVLAAYQNKSCEHIQAFDIETYFERLGLLQHLSPSRGNGVRAIVENIRKVSR